MNSVTNPAIQVDIIGAKIAAIALNASDHLTGLKSILTNEINK